MIINSLCNSCLQPFNVIVEPADVPLVKEVSDEDGEFCNCPRLCGGKINLMGDPIISDMAGDRRFRDPMVITGKQLYQAVNGLGLPDELPKDVEVVDSLLKSRKVEEASFEEFQGKIYLHELSLSGGIKIHLASGIKGAQILKITKENTHGR